ncbi:Tyrosine 2,3-aminomutase [subsurface metagenome]
MVVINKERNLNLDDFQQLLFANASLDFSKEILLQVENNFSFLQKYAENKIIYGINTGLGPMAQYKIDDDKSTDLQLNLIRSHAAGAGEALDDLSVLASLIVRAQCFCGGYSGVHTDVLQILKQLINHRITPFIPEHGGVGASGDLIQLAHIALVLIGEGKAKYKNKWHDTSKLFEQLGIHPLEVRIREGLALINGTSVMTGIGIVNLTNALNLLNWSVLASVMINEIVSTFDDHCSPELNSLKLHHGQKYVASVMHKMFSESKLTANRNGTLYSNSDNGSFKIDKKVQEYYSLRCVPQILGPVFDALQFSSSVLIDEANSISDNPIIHEDSNYVYHGGNFHGDYVAFEMDKMKIAITKLTMLAERQLNFVLNHRLNKILPPFVNLGTLGLNLGMQGAQFTAVSTTAENQTLSNPMYIHSIPNNNDNQDIVSMGTNAAIMTKKVLDNSYHVLAIEFMALLQAIDYLNMSEKLSPETHKVYKDLRNIFPKFESDYPIYKDMEKVISFINSNHKRILSIQ